jgi:heat shock protein HtpX
MYSQIAANKRRTVLIFAVFLVLIALLAWLLDLYLVGSHGSLGIFYGILAGGIIYAVISYYAGMRLSLAVNRAQEIHKSDNPRLFRIIENLAITDGLPMPRVFIMNDPAPNAFATGRNPKNSAVCATSGLLEIMNDQELECVFAHELGHVKNYDIRVSMCAFALGAIVSLIADVIIRMTWFRGGRDQQENNQYIMILAIIAAIIAPIVATLIELAVSRRREYLADATSALTTRYPEGLISALQKIEKTGSVLSHQNTSTAHFFFANPLRGHSITNLFSTHPPIKDRIARLQKMETHA